MTRWYKPSEKLPANNEKVLVRHGDSIELALFDAEKKLLKLRDGTVFGITSNIMWMQLLTELAG